MALFLAALLANIAQGLIYFLQLPDPVAAHFNAAGVVNSWMSRRAFVGFKLGVSFFVAIMVLLPAIALRKTPDAKINLPNKEYWLAPERREETFHYFEAFFLWFGAATQVLLLDVFHQVFRVNIGLAKTLEHPRASLACYVAFCFVCVAHMLRRFLRRE